MQDPQWQHRQFMKVIAEGKKRKERQEKAYAKCVKDTKEFLTDIMEATPTAEDMKAIMAQHPCRVHNCTKSFDGLCKKRRSQAPCFPYEGYQWVGCDKEFLADGDWV